MIKAVFERIEALESEYVEFWADVCRIESPTENKKAVDEVGNFMIQKAKARGWSVDVCKQEVSGDAICITMNPESKNPAVCFSAHMDTVHPIGSFGENPVRIENGKIYGPGTVDCKGGFVSSFMAMAALEDCGFRERPIKLILQSDEETSSKGSNLKTVEYMCEQAKGSIAFINCEGYTPGKATLERKGILRYSFEVRGKAAHAARCTDGINAIREAAYKITELEKMKDSDGVTCSCGLISGGTAINTVAQYCKFMVDIRFRDMEQMKLAEDKVCEIAKKSFVEGSSCDVTLLSKRIPMVYSEKNYELLNSMNEIFKEVGLPQLEANFRPGGSDAAYVTAAGIPCVDSLGVAGEKIHNPNEAGLISSLTLSAKMLASTAMLLNR